MIPTILLTGFLGAGKTTLLNRLIEFYNSQKTVILINEFGKVGIDGELLIAGNYKKIELNKGSLFCICVRTDFIAEVEKIATQIKPELLIIEATGLADTSEMENMLSLPNLKNHISLQTCLCVVDCDNFLKIKDNLKAPASQIKSADLVLLNKVDLVSENQLNEVEHAVSQISPHIPTLKTTYAQFPLEKLDAIYHPNISETSVLGDGRPDNLISITLKGKGHFTQNSWRQFKALIQPNLMRLKGFIILEQETYYVDATMDRWSMSPRESGTEHTNRLVLIGQQLNQQHIEERFYQFISA